MADTWRTRVARARQLGGEVEAAADLLRFYARVLEGQEACADRLAPAPLTGRLDDDLPSLREGVPSILRAVEEAGPPDLAGEARQLMASDAATLEVLLTSCWASPVSDGFFGKALLQPYASTLVSRSVPLTGRPAAGGPALCPRCGGRPQLALLDPSDAQGNGGGRKLLCAMCLSAWPVPRLRCAACGEDDERRLGYFHDASFGHVVIEACDACRSYQKRIDRSKLGIAVPIVDEMAAAALDLWAVDKGYRKIEVNLVGL